MSALLSQVRGPAYIARHVGHEYRVEDATQDLATLLDRPLGDIIEQPVATLFPSLPPPLSRPPTSNGSFPPRSGLLHLFGHTHWVEVHERSLRGPASRRLALMHATAVDAASLGISGDSPRSLRMLHELVQAAGTQQPTVLVGEPATGKAQLALFLAGLIAGGTEGVVQFNSARANAATLSRIDPATRVVVVSNLQMTSHGIQDQILASALQFPAHRWVFTSTVSPSTMAEDGALRSALAQRLTGSQVRVPSLRERPSDLPLMALQMAREMAGPSRPILAISHTSQTRLATHAWPGNRTELRSCIERALHLATGAVLELRPRHETPHTRGKPIQTLEQAIRDHLITALKAADWQIEGEQGAASLLGLAPSTLRSKIKRYRIRRQ